MVDMTQPRGEENKRLWQKRKGLIRSNITLYLFKFPELLISYKEVLNLTKQKENILTEGMSFTKHAEGIHVTKQRRWTSSNICHESYQTDKLHIKTEELHLTNRGTTSYKQRNYILQTEELHLTNRGTTSYKHRNYIIQGVSKKMLHFGFWHFSAFYAAMYDKS